MIETMDADSAATLLAAALEGRAQMRRGEDASAVEGIERQYAEMREAMAWFLDQGRLDEADRFGTALVPFWMATKRIDDGDWLVLARRRPDNGPTRSPSGQGRLRPRLPGLLGGPL